MATITTIAGSDVISTSRTTINTNFANLNSDKIETSYLDTDTTLAANSDSKIATQKATKAYVLANVNPTGASWNEYAADAGSTDAYVITLTGVAAYATGQTFKFKANTANTGAATLKVNSLAAITIKKDVSSDLATGDILANQDVVVIYDGTNMQLVSLPSGTANATTILPLTTAKQYTVGALDNALVKLYFNIQLSFILWTGAVVNDTTTTFANWTRTDATKVVIPPMGMMASFASTDNAVLYMQSILYSSGSTVLAFTDTNIIILDFWAKYVSGTGECFWGFISDSSSVSGLYGDNMTRAGFMIKNGVLYATSSKADPSGTEQETNIGSSVTETNWNNYRIELDLNVSIKYYVNGVLLHTETTVLPIASQVGIGFGRNTTNPVLFNVTAPNLSLEMNP